MSTSQPTFPRRDLLRGTAALVGGAAMGLLPTFVEAAMQPSSTPFSLAFWDGHRFVSLPRPTIAGAHQPVRLTVSSVEGGGFAALEAHAPCTGAGRHPFTLWVAPPAGLVSNRATVAAEINGSLVLGVHTKGGTRHEAVLPAGCREGTYVLVPGKADLSALRMDETGLVQSSFPLIRIEVERV